MFPYNKTPIRTPKTSREIQQFGRQSLLRALNIGRVVLMTGSGTSRQFHQPSWNDLKTRAFKFVKEFEKVAQGTQSSFDSQNTGGVTRGIHPTNGEAADAISSRRLTEFWQELNAGKDNKDLQAPLFIELVQEFLRLAEEEGIGEYLKNKSLNEFRKEMASQFRIQCNISNPNLSDFDGPRAFANKLGVWRYLTLNYDLELEQMLFEEVRGAGEDQKSDFAQFLSAHAGEGSEADDADWRGKIGRTVTLESGTGRLIRSTSSRPNTLADLFIFGAFPNNYNASVHHLHGRLDDPENMVLSAKDYQRVYFGNSHQKRSFDEARSVVATGSDIVIIGMGYSESEVLEPWRNFLENEGVAEEISGKVYYFTCADIDVSMLKARNFRTDWQKASRQKSDKKVHELFQTYGIFCIVVDDPIHFEDIQSCATKSRRESGCPENIELFPGKSRFEKSKIELLRQLHFCRVAVAFVLNSDMNKQWGDSDFDNLFKLENASQFVVPEFEQFKEIVTCSNGSTLQDRKRELIELTNRLFSRVLVVGVELLQVQKADWWRDWSRLPSFRLAVYGPYREPKNDQVLTSENPLVWKHSNLVADFRTLCDDLNGQKAGTSRSQSQDDPRENWGLETSIRFTGPQENRRKQLSSLIELTHKSARQTDSSHSRVCRVTMPSGAGKGRLMALLFNKHRFQSNISPSDETEDYLFKRLFGDGINGEVQPYIGGFMAHLTFNIEFNSVIVGFCRFVQQLLPTFFASGNSSKLGIENTFEYLANYDFAALLEKEKSSIQVLGEMFDFLVDIAPIDDDWPVRSLAVFSNLGRLANRLGEGYSPYHRVFFRLINVSENPKYRNLPFDFLFINSRADTPIQYLSESISFDKYKKSEKSERDHTRFRPFKSKGFALRQWPLVKQASVPYMINEGLNIALKNGLIRNFGFPPKVSETDLKDIRDVAIEFSDLKKIPEGEIVFCSLTEREQFSQQNSGWPRSLYEHACRKVVFAHILGSLISEILFSHLLHMLRGKEPTISSFHEIFSSDLDKVKFQCQDYWRRKSNDLASRIRGEADVGLFRELFKIYNELDQRSTTAKEEAQPTPSTDQRRRIYVPETFCQNERLRQRIQNHLALFGHPVTAQTLRACPEIKRLYPNNPKVLKEKTDWILLQLCERGFVAKLKKYKAIAIPAEDLDPNQTAEKCDTSDYLFALNSSVSEAIRHEMRLKISGRHQRISFQPTIFPSQVPSDIKPDGKHFLIVREMMDSLLARPNCEDLPSPNCNSQPNYCKRFNNLSERVRAAYMLLRGTFSIDVISRLSSDTESLMGFRPFDEYRRWTREILNLSVLIGAAQDYDRIQDPPTQTYLRIWAPLYREEITWLFNERALISFTQGRLFDALPLFNLAQSNTRAKGKNYPARSGGAIRRRIALNQGIAWLESGNIQSAKSKFRLILDEASPRWNNDTISTVPIYARGYLGLCSHLSDDILTAEAEYCSVLEELAHLQKTRDQEEARGQSIFSRHYADLLRAQAKRSGKRNFKLAQEALNNSEQIAQSINAIDLKHYSMIARARLFRDQDNRGEALACLREAEQFATRMGLYKMLVEVLKVRGELLLEEGEATQAGIVTARSVAMAKRNGMRLRKISAAIIQARILKIRNQFLDANRLLVQTLNEAETLGYFIKSGEAQSLVQSLDFS